VSELNAGGGAKPFRAEQPWQVIPRRLARVTLNSAGYPEYDGKAIFPMGIFNGGKFKEQAEAGFTVTHAYNAVRLEEDRENADQNALRYIDGTQANGMKMLFMVPMKAAIAGDFDAVRRRVRTFRNHPGLLAWDEEEGFGRGDFKPDTLKKLRQIITEEDPNHPFMVGDPYDVISRIKSRSNFFPVSEMDMGMWWWYPLPLKKPSATMATTAQALEGEEEQARWDELTPPQFLTKANTDKPLWVGVQSYKKKDSRYPTPLEYRAQAYIAIIHGAKGLMWYGGSVTGGLFLAPEEGHWDDLQKIVKELHGLAPEFMSPTVDTPKVSPAGALISVCIKESPDRRVMLAANRGPATLEVTFSSSKLKPGSAKVVSENRELKTSAGELRDTFAPYVVHVYDLPH
jgi:hypothetical protein